MSKRNLFIKILASIWLAPIFAVYLWFILLILNLVVLNGAFPTEAIIVPLFKVSYLLYLALGLDATISPEPLMSYKWQRRIFWLHPSVNIPKGSYNPYKDRLFALLSLASFMFYVFYPTTLIFGPFWGADYSKPLKGLLIFLGVFYFPVHALLTGYLCEQFKLKEPETTKDNEAEIKNRP